MAASLVVVCLSSDARNGRRLCAQLCATVRDRNSLGNCFEHWSSCMQGSCDGSIRTDRENDDGGAELGLELHGSGHRRRCVFQVLKGRDNSCFQTQISVGATRELQITSGSRHPYRFGDNTDAAATPGRRVEQGGRAGVRRVYPRVCSSQLDILDCALQACRRGREERVPE